MGDCGLENTKGTDRGGRPRKHAPDIKRHNVTVVMTAPMRDAIREAAEANGRSVSAEIDFRLGLSLALEKDAGGAATRQLMDFAKLASTSIRTEFGHDWTESVEAASALGGAMDLLIRASSPPLPEATAIASSDAELEAISAELAEVRERAQRGEKDAGKGLRKVIMSMMAHMTERESIMAFERNRRLAGARLIASVVRLLVGKDVSPEALLGWPSGNQ